MPYPEYVLEIKPHLSGQAFTLEHVDSHKKWQGTFICLEQILTRIGNTVQIIDHRYSDSSKPLEG